MYRLRKHEDFSYLVGLELIHLGIGQFQVTFGFSSDVSISVESYFTYKTGAVEIEWKPESLQAAASTLNLVGKTVEVAKAIDERTLELRFSNNDVLQIFDSSDQYESFIISSPGKTFVV